MLVITQMSGLNKPQSDISGPVLTGSIYLSRCVQRDREKINLLSFDLAF